MASLEQNERQSKLLTPSTTLATALQAIAPTKFDATERSFSSLPFFALRVLVVGGERKKTGSSKSFCATDLSVAAAIDRGERRTLASGVGASVLSKRVASESAGFMTDGRD